MQPLIVTAAIILKEGLVLVTRRPDGKPHAGMWEFPGGKLDAGETPQECLRREIREELDLEVTVGPIFEVVFHRYAWGPVLILAFECHPIGGTIRNLQVAEHRWVTPRELHNLDILPADLPIIAKLNAPA